MGNFDLEQLLRRVAVLIDEDRYTFSDEDMALLKEIKAELQGFLDMESATGKLNTFDLLSLVTKFMKLFEAADSFIDLF